MKLIINRHGLSIAAETMQDEVYIEEVLGLKTYGDTVALQRVTETGDEHVYLDTMERGNKATPIQSMILESSATIPLRARHDIRDGGVSRSNDD